MDRVSQGRFDLREKHVGWLQEAAGFEGFLEAHLQGSQGLLGPIMSQNVAAPS